MVVGVARSMMKAKGLPGWLWGEDVVTAVYLLNRIPCKALEGKTQFEVWYGRRPTMHHLRTFSCIVYVKNTKSNMKKLEDRGRKMVFVEYEHGSKAYIAYDPLTGRATITCNVVFDELAQWDWAGGDEGDDDNIDSHSNSFMVQYMVLYEGGDNESEVESITPLVGG
jgi:hypothetical protein